MAVTPLVNILMLVARLAGGQVEPGLAVAAVLSTAFYVAAAIALAARIFGTDAILYGSQATWSDIFRRPAEPQKTASVAAAMLCLALMFPACFLLTNNLGRSRDASLSMKLLAISLITAGVFGGIPLVVATFGRVRASSGFGLVKARPLQFLAAALLGVSLWPVAHEIYLASVGLGMSSLGKEQFEQARQTLDALQSMPLWAILLTFAVVPAVFEEFFFRGFLFAALGRRFPAGKRSSQPRSCSACSTKYSARGGSCRARAWAWCWVGCGCGRAAYCRVWCFTAAQRTLALGEPLARNTRGQRPGNGRIETSAEHMAGGGCGGNLRRGRDVTDVDTRETTAHAQSPTR